MNNKRLIEAVRKYPALYEMSDRKYINSNYKSSLWVKIGEEIKETDANCKKRWSNIRDQFKRTLNKKETISRQSSTAIKKYKNKEILQFLLTYIQNRKTIYNIEDDDTDTNKLVKQQEQESQEMGTDNNQCTKEIRNEGDTDTQRARVTGDRVTEIQSNDESTTQQSGKSSNCSSGKVSKSHTVPHKQSSSETLMKYIIENNAKKQNEYNKSHPNK
ncbi:unnamed protein product [Parnassius mnemosyne]|uniref:MADF domain-containing protein n=1 Tax=Parnassius mnemosyne TaxID=213953 RepID=A0AAV1L0R6_9NEOP